jgi:hypothetical protein
MTEQEIWELMKILADNPLVRENVELKEKVRIYEKAIADLKGQIGQMLIDAKEKP